MQSNKNVANKSWIEKNLIGSHRKKILLVMSHRPTSVLYHLIFFIINLSVIE